jgi:hypothetical protein
MNYQTLGQLQKALDYLNQALSIYQEFGSSEIKTAIEDEIQDMIDEIRKSLEQQ